MRAGLQRRDQPVVGAADAGGVAQPGGGSTRTEKVATIGALAAVRDHIRVCWEGDRHGRNCGRCEKCVRTKLNFLAAGYGTVPALGPLLPGEVRALTIGSSGAHAVFAELLDETDRLAPDVADDIRWLLAQPIGAHGGADDEAVSPPPG